MTAIAVEVTRDLVTVQGPDAATFLQGQCSQDVDALAVGTASWTLVLHPTGKVHTWARIVRRPADAFVLDVEGGCGEALAERLRRFLIRTRAELSTTSVAALAVRGDLDLQGPPPEGVERLPVPEAWGGGFDLLAAPGAPVPGPPAGARLAGLEDLHEVRVQQGIPAMGAELDEDTIPAEIGSWFVDSSVSFTKGCYVGQELVARLDARGNNVPRRLVRLRAGAALPVGAAVDSDDGPVSPVTTSAGSIALAFAGRRVPDGATVTVDGRSAIVEAFTAVAGP